MHIKRFITKYSHLDVVGSMHSIPTVINGTASVMPCTSEQDSTPKYFEYAGI